MGRNNVSVGQLNFENGVRQHFCYHALKFDYVVFSQNNSSSLKALHKQFADLFAQALVRKQLHIDPVGVT